MKILNFYYNLSCILLASAYLCTALHIPPRIPALIIINISGSVSNSNFTSVFFKHACYADPGADKI